MKTLEDYMDDPRLVNDPGMVDALEPIIRIHAIRLKIQDETAGMTVEERNALFKKNADALFARLGLPPIKYADLSGQGKLKPREATPLNPQKTENGN